jgi:predicted HTH transcriptional regulator
MVSPKPKDVFTDPQSYWEFLTAPRAEDFECQHFDRKEAGRAGTDGSVTGSQVSKLRDQTIECISAFSNSNKGGGLLVVGISNTGEVTGVQHLSEQQRNSLTNINVRLVNQSTTVKYVDCEDKNKTANKIILVYAPYVDNGICETLGYPPEAWVRSGPQNLPMSGGQREQLFRDKKIVDFEQRYCCPFDISDVDKGVLNEFRKVYLAGAAYDHSDYELLYQCGALIRKDDDYLFTHAGSLFFSANPQRSIAWAYIRLLRFESNSDEGKKELPTLDKSFTGPVTTQIRQLRTFFRESGFFKIYQRRNPNGGFTEEPEYPFIAVDEAIVNAVVHRDYGIKLPIECEYYKDAFVVRNSGPVIQREQDVPADFTLENTHLDSMPRNPRLTEWLKQMRDERGAEFVRALSEGTRIMQQEMASLGLPSPKYHVSSAQTTVMLNSNAAERERTYNVSPATKSTAFINLFRLFASSVGTGEQTQLADSRKELMATLRDALLAKGWFVDSIRYGRIVAHRLGSEIAIRNDAINVVRFYPAYVFQFRNYNNHDYLSIDYTLEVKNVLTVGTLVSEIGVGQLLNRPCVAKSNGWRRGKIIEADDENCLVRFYDDNTEEHISSGFVIPDLPKSTIDQNLAARGISFELDRAIRQHSLSLHSGAARVRADKVNTVARNISKQIFPFLVTGRNVEVIPDPVNLVRRDADGGQILVIPLSEPRVEFHHHQETQDIRDGITRYGAYSQTPKEIELIPLCVSGYRDAVEKLIDRLRTGKFNYKGAERTFSTRLNYRSITTVDSVEKIPGEVERLLKQYPNWVGNPLLDRLFLVHTPEKGYALDDQSSPYYKAKRCLLENGLPCQMLDTGTILNPDWKDLNLALNITAKCGVVPWVLPDAIPNADFFVGLSYTQSVRQEGDRLMGYANVFNQYGRWEFYSGNTEAFPYDEKSKHLAVLVKNTLERLRLSESPNVYFHYSAKFSGDDRQAILSAARQVRKHGTFAFVWINTHHNLRMYDSRPETDGSLERGNYIVTSANQIYLSTTGYNPYRKALGTPKPLEVNIWIEKPDGTKERNPDLRALAVQILSLTKLNWASTDSLCGEPITVKYAGDIAYLTAAFLRQKDIFKLHPVLERTPWFI